MYTSALGEKIVHTMSCVCFDFTTLRCMQFCLFPKLVQLARLFDASALTCLHSFCVELEKGCRLHHCLNPSCNVHHGAWVRCSSWVPGMFEVRSASAHAGLRRLRTYLCIGCLRWPHGHPASRRSLTDPRVLCVDCYSNGQSITGQQPCTKSSWTK